MDMDHHASAVVCGNAFHTPRLGHIESLVGYLFCIDDEGTITDLIAPGHAHYEAVRQRAHEAGRLTVLSDGQYLLPGLIDLHVHASQWPQAGKALDRPVIEWLDDHALPLEARFSDADFALGVWRKAVRMLLANGTTTAAYFATIHKEASALLAEVCQAYGQRALVGKVVMDNTLCPTYYRDASVADAVADTTWLVDRVRALNSALVHPVITPRFIPNCSDDVLRELGVLAQQTGVYVQTHCAESDWVHEHVQARLGRSGVQAFAEWGLLTPHTLLAHANFLDDAASILVREHGSTLVHCPVSNVFFANSVLPVAEHLRQGTQLALGSDVAGGFSPSLFDAMRQAIMSSRMLEDGVDPRLAAASRGRPHSRIGFREAFWLATTGGAQALGMPLGYFDVGRQWDAIVIDTDGTHSNIYRFPDLDSELDVLEKIINHAQRCNVSKVWVAGRVVHEVASGATVP